MHKKYQSYSIFFIFLYLKKNRSSSLNSLKIIERYDHQKIAIILGSKNKDKLSMGAKLLTNKERARQTTRQIGKLTNNQTERWTERLR